MFVGVLPVSLGLGSAMLNGASAGDRYSMARSVSSHPLSSCQQGEWQLSTGQVTAVDRKEVTAVNRGSVSCQQGEWQLSTGEVTAVNRGSVSCQQGEWQLSIGRRWQLSTGGVTAVNMVRCHLSRYHLSRCHLSTGGVTDSWQHEGWQLSIGRRWQLSTGSRRGWGGGGRGEWTAQKKQEWRKNEVRR